jgi:hypothetical protein
MPTSGRRADAREAFTRRLASLVVLVAGLISATGCATLRELANDVPAHIRAATKPVKYVLAGADPSQRQSLERGQAQLKAGEHRLALPPLRQALWDAERIDSRWLRLEELAETYQTLAAVYAGLRKDDWAAEHRAVAVALAQYPGRDGDVPAPDRALTRGKSAYRAARFREATTALGEALIELQGISHTPVRVASLEETRCLLVLSRFALDQDERVREEIRRLAALDDSLASCRRQAPPAVQAFIRRVQTSDAPAARRSP